MTQPNDDLIRDDNATSALYDSPGTDSSVGLEPTSSARATPAAGVGPHNDPSSLPPTSTRDARRAEIAKHLRVAAGLALIAGFLYYFIATNSYLLDRHFSIVILGGFALLFAFMSLYLEGGADRVLAVFDPVGRYIRKRELQQQHGSASAASPDKLDATNPPIKENPPVQVEIADKWEVAIAESVARIQDAVRNQGLRGNLNLMLGCATAVAGVTLLTYTIYFSPQPPETVTAFLLTFIPRLSIVAIVEVFAYFFLRLYKASIAEIKYFQNEATNLEARHAAIRLAMEKGDSALIAQVTTQLMQVERNPLLTAGTSTWELEREKLDHNVVSLSIPQIVEVVRLGMAQMQNSSETRKS
jgi:hypothetical protein